MENARFQPVDSNSLQAETRFVFFFLLLLLLLLLPSSPPTPLLLLATVCRGSLDLEDEQVLCDRSTVATSGTGRGAAGQ